ncbi:MAG: 50S ribosomal protein L13 [Firmicutes bacterium]|nr:50S ribosomal protein L13 [Bacillota bacterium]MCL5040507.1 50S ribosomal protein L13 [Bacillota bacterium]
MRTTFMAKPQDIQRKWFVVDATGKPLGRLASQVASILRGKHKPTYTPHLDTGDFVIVVNAEKVVLTGNKKETKIWYHHSMYPGGLKAIPYGKLLASKPEKVIELAVKGMLQHNRLGRKMGKKLKVYRGPEHPHAAQKPEELKI